MYFAINLANGGGLAVLPPEPGHEPGLLRFNCGAHYEQLPFLIISFAVLVFNS